MKKIYRIYAQCCTHPHPFKEIDADVVNEEIEKLAGDYFDNNTDFLDEHYGENNEKAFDLAYQAICSFLTSDWEKYRQLDCGDYELKELDDEDYPTYRRPNICGYPHYSEKEILNWIEENK
jgi:hypothetical protein